MASVVAVPAIAGLLAVAWVSPGFAQLDPDKIQIRREAVAGKVHVLFGAGGNIGVSVGEDGLLIVDDQFAPLADKIKTALAELNPDPVAYVVNTHFHHDHTGGNPEFGREAIIVAHDNVRTRVMTAQEFTRGTSTPLPKEGWPVITYDQSVTIHFNGEAIDLIHMPNGHTDGDTVVHFTGSGVAHMGDHFFVGRFPFVDLEAGGDVEGLTRNIGKVLEMMPDSTRYIPGHGGLAGQKELQAYHDMLIKTTDIVRQGIAAGKDAAALKEAGLGPEWDEWGTGFIKPDRWIDTVYTSLTRD